MDRHATWIWPVGQCSTKRQSLIDDSNTGMVLSDYSFYFWSFRASSTTFPDRVRSCSKATLSGLHHNCQNLIGPFSNFSYVTFPYLQSNSWFFSLIPTPERISSAPSYLTVWDRPMTEGLSSGVMGDSVRILVQIHGWLTLFYFSLSILSCIIPLTYFIIIVFPPLQNNPWIYPNNPINSDQIYPC